MPQENEFEANLVDPSEDGGNLVDPSEDGGQASLADQGEGGDVGDARLQGDGPNRIGD